MNIAAAISRLIKEFDPARGHTRIGGRQERRDAGPAILRLPPEIRRDLGYPDSCTVRMSTRGHQRPCHERW